MMTMDIPTIEQLLTGNFYTPEQIREMSGSTNNQTGEPRIDPLKYRAEDGGVLDAWREHYSAKWIFATGVESWYFWNGTHWQRDTQLLMEKEVLELLDYINQCCRTFQKETPERIKRLMAPYDGIEAPESVLRQVDDIKRQSKFADAIQQATRRTKGRVASIEGMARSVRAMPISAFDIEESLNLANGVLDLNTLKLYPHSPERLFTYTLPYGYDPSAKAPLAEKFFSEVLVKEGTEETDYNLLNLFYELLGYSLTTRVNRECMVWMFGDGGNGKSVTISLIKKLLGPMATSVDFQSLGQSGNYDLADVPGKRVLLSAEAEKGGTVAEKLIKYIVSGDPLKARPIYGSPIDFTSTAKIWWSMNDRPVIKDTSNAIWRRMKLIPFYRQFEEGKNADVHLPAKLEKELPGILNLALQGLRRLEANDRFTHSESAEAAKLQYREDSDPVARWLKLMTVPTGHPVTLQGALHRSFCEWMQLQNEKNNISSQQFGRDMKRLNIESKRMAKGIFYHLALIGTM